MALATKEEAFTILRKLKDAYRISEDKFDRQREKAYEVESAASGKDENFLIGAAAGNILDASGDDGPAYDPALIGVLLVLASIIGTSSSSRNTMIAVLAKWMRDNSYEVKSRGATYDSINQDVTGSKVGSQVLAICSVMPDGTVNESATIEDLRFICQNSATTRRGLGQERYTVRGDGIDDISEFQSGGRGIEDTQVKGTAPGVDSIVKNSSWDNAFNGSGANKIPGGWEITSGDANVERVTADADIAQDRGRNHGALRISGDCTIRYYFRKQGVALSRVRPYGAGFRGKKAGTPTFTLDVDIGSNGAASPLDGDYDQSDFTTSYADKRLDSDRANAWADTFDEDGDPYIEIQVSSSTFGGSEYLYLDDFFMREMLQVAGRYVQVQSGLTAAVKDDEMSQRCTLDRGAGSVELTGGGSGSVDGITVDGVEIMNGAEAFDTDLNTTAQNVVENINGHVTYPNYVAERSGATINIYQEKPVAGTLTVTASTTTITTTDTNVTGASLGEIQDFIVRRTGLHLPHAASATSGFGD